MTLLRGSINVSVPRYLHEMVVLENVANVYIQEIVKKNIKFYTVVDVNKCLKQIKLPIVLFKCTRIYHLIQVQ